MWYASHCFLMLVVSIFAALPPDDGEQPRSIIGDLNKSNVVPLTDAELAGLTATARPEVVTVERAYALALIRARGPKPTPRPFPATLDPKAVAEASERLGVKDFARFRKEFFEARTGDPASFRNPAPAVLDLLFRLQAIANARRNVEGYANLAMILKELIMGETSGLAQFEVDEVDARLQLARLELEREMRRYRDGLDALKVQLGLSPHAPIAIDRAGIAAFERSFEAATRWSANPKRSLADLLALVDGLPVLDIPTVDGRKLFAADTGPDRSIEEMLVSATRVAIKNRPSLADDDAELRIRGRVRRLIDERSAYDLAKREFVLLLRQKSSIQEQLVSPPANGPVGPAVPRTRELIEIQARFLSIQNRLVRSWANFQAERSELDADLGTMPFDDWKSFLDSFVAKPAPRP